jgi:hypothetical protein
LALVRCGQHAGGAGSAAVAPVLLHAQALRQGRTAAMRSSWRPSEPFAHVHVTGLRPGQPGD